MMYRQGPAPANSCPRCRETLIASREEPGLRFCELCGGVFADTETSRRIVRSLDRELLALGFDASAGKARKEYDARRLACPECLIEMQRVRVEAAACEVDACPLHGTWFDTGELVDVMRAMNRARKQGAMPPGAVPAPYTPPLGKAETEDDGEQMLREAAESLSNLFHRILRRP